MGWRAPLAIAAQRLNRWQLNAIEVKRRDAGRETGLQWLVKIAVGSCVGEVWLVEGGENNSTPWV